MKSSAADAPSSPLVAAAGDFAAAGDAQQADTLARARAFAQPLIAHEQLDTGENTLAHADAVASILQDMGATQAMQAASYLVYACAHLNRPQEVISKAFGDAYATLALETNKLVAVQRQARSKQGSSAINPGAASQTENVRKMLLAFSRDLRVVMLRLASRLQSLRFYAATKQAVPQAVAQESLQVFAPLANRLGIWQIKWEMEDLAFRFLEPPVYKEVAKLLDEKRVEREAYVEQVRQLLTADLSKQGVAAQVQGRPKHIYSIVKKMRGKALAFDEVMDVRALRIIAPDAAQCYAALAHVHQQFAPIANEFDDYIAKPKSNGYQSLHTVVRNSAGLPIEIQIRTQAMHDHAETGVAAHWAYKEAGAKGYAGVSAGGQYDAKIAVLRQLLAWERELSQPQAIALSPALALSKTQAQSSAQNTDVLADRIYVLTPDAAIVDLPCGATPVDFAYTVHTNLGHRCRGARIDGAMVPLNTALQNGQTVEVTVAKEGGPSRDWLNADLGYLASPRARAKVRAWFNALATDEVTARGREAVEKLLQREGKTALKLSDLAEQLGFKTADELFELVGKDEFSLRTIEQLFRPAAPATEPDDIVLAKTLRKAEKAHGNGKSGVLVVGVDSLLTQLAKCCKPAPPDAIGGFVTRGKGVSIHRADCPNLRALTAKDAGRVIEVQWGTAKAQSGALYPVDVAIEASDRSGLLRDISEVFAKDKMNVIGVQTQSLKGSAFMTFTVQVADSGVLTKALTQVREVKGVHTARRL